MSNYVEFAKQEFKILGWDKGKDEMQKLICDQLIELLEVFGKEGHSGTSAPYTVNLFKKLALFQPISPLTGDDSEWTEVGEKRWQNKRCSHVFKEENEKAYDIDGKIFKRKDGTCFTNIDSRVFIEFHYTPKSEYIEVEDE